MSTSLTYFHVDPLHIHAVYLHFPFLTNLFPVAFLSSQTDADISDFVHNLESQNIKVEMMKHGDYMAAAPHSAAINVTGSSKVILTGKIDPIFFHTLYLMSTFNKVLMVQINLI